MNLVGLRERLGGDRAMNASSKEEKEKENTPTPTDQSASSPETKSKEEINETGLYTPIGAGGSGYSNGEKQMMCLTRMLVRNTPILALDEASSSTDAQTDMLMQKIIRDKFKDCTIITIAHRLLTIADYDKVLLLRDGAVAEFDAPHTLLQNPESRFSKMVGVLSEAEGDSIRRIAKEHFEEKLMKK